MHVSIMDRQGWGTGRGFDRICMDIMDQVANCELATGCTIKPGITQCSPSNFIHSACGKIAVWLINKI